MKDDEIRDMFAAAALHGLDLTILPKRNEFDANKQNVREQKVWDIALAAYEVAGEMMKVREMTIREAAKEAAKASPTASGAVQTTVKVNADP